MTARRLRTGFAPAITATAAFILWAWYHLDFFRFTRPVPRADGSLVHFPNALASVDHPFHATRFDAFLHALANGHVPRWIFSHQGGYPTEFYPFGSSAVDLVVWAASLGQMSIPMVHTWAVALVFVLPAIGFFGIARLANLNPWIAAFATVGHMCVRGWWWSGGSYELIEWGLITNVLAAYLVFLALVGLARALDGGSNRWLGLVALLIGWAEVTNPRSALAVATILAAALIVWWTDSRRSTQSVRRLALPIVLGIGLAAPVLMPLFRYRELYYFVPYQHYANLHAWWDSSVQAISTPFMILAIIGLPLALSRDATVIERMLAWSLIIYVAGTIYLLEIDWPSTLTEQLEITRLMPFQRLLMFALAAIAIGRLANAIPRPGRDLACAGMALLVPVLFVWTPPSFIPESDRGLVRQGTMAQVGIVDLQSAVELADAESAPNTAMIIVGPTAYWHDHMWGLLWTDRLLYYDDWLWYWQKEQVGDYNPDTEHAFPLDSSAIDEAYLRTHGIGSIVVTGQAKPIAQAAPFLTRIREGIYDVYVLNAPTTTATLDGANVPATIDDQTITITGLEAGGTLTVRENWFPRWQASDGLTVIHRADGYMDVQIPPGTDEITLTYARTGFDWLASTISLVCGLLALALLAGIRPTARWGLRGSSVQTVQTQP